MMNDKAQYDVVVVGGGIAGMIAANRAAQLNLRTVVLEQGSDEKYLCNTRYTGGTFHICLREITLDEETIYQAGTVEALANAARLPAAALNRTLSEYNAAIADGRLQSGLTPSRQTMRYDACPIVTNPFYAVPMCAGITYTMGGISVNEHAQALRADGSVIAGLYALGSATGGLEGGPAIGYVGGLAKCGVTALVSAEHVAAGIGQN